MNSKYSWSGVYVQAALNHLMKSNQIVTQNVLGSVCSIYQCSRLSSLEGGKCWWNPQILSLKCQLIFLIDLFLSIASFAFAQLSLFPPSQSQPATMLTDLLCNYATSLWSLARSLSLLLIFKAFKTVCCDHCIWASTH